MVRRWYAAEVCRAPQRSSLLLLIVRVKVSAQLATVVVTRVPSSTSGMHACITWYLKNCNFMLQWWIPEVHSFAYVLPDTPPPPSSGGFQKYTRLHNVLPDTPPPSPSIHTYTVTHCPYSMYFYRKTWSVHMAT